MIVTDDSNVEATEEQTLHSPTMEGNTSVTFSSPPNVTRLDDNFQSNANNGGGSDRKRSRRAMADDGALDDIMGQSKLCSLLYNPYIAILLIFAFCCQYSNVQADHIVYQRAH